MQKVVCTTLILTWALGAAGSAQAGGKDKKSVPEPGTTFHLSPTVPKYVTCDIEFRDSAGKLWPNFFYGKPATAGSFSYDPKTPKGSFAILCDHMAQKNGDQSRRVLGALLKDGKPPLVKLIINSVGAFETIMVDAKDKKGQPVKKSAEVLPMEGVLQIDAREIPFKAPATLRFNFSKKTNSYELVTMQIHWQVKDGTTLGLDSNTGPINITASLTAYAQPDGGKKK